VGKLDRTKYAWDVMEHVAGGVRPIDTADDEMPHAHVVDLGTRRKGGGRATSTVHVTVLTNDDETEVKPR
jgi:hypothetical protein